MSAPAILAQYQGLANAAAQRQQLQALGSLGAANTPQPYPGSPAAVAVRKPIDFDAMPILEYLRRRTEEWLSDVRA